MKLSTRYGAVGIAALAALTAVQWLRESGHSEGEIPAYLLGVLPNLFAAIAITFVVLSFFADQRKLTHSRNATPWFLLAATISGAGLTAWEYFQRTSDSLVFDLHDIAATIVGVALSIVFFLLVTPRAESMPPT
jgi:apolipoprotein N-acyltransferase